MAPAQTPKQFEAGRLQTGLRAVENMDEVVRAGAERIGGELFHLGIDLGDGPRQSVAVPNLDRVQVDGGPVHAVERGAARDLRALRRARREMATLGRILDTAAGLVRRDDDVHERHIGTAAGEMKGGGTAACQVFRHFLLRAGLDERALELRRHRPVGLRHAGPAEMRASGNPATADRQDCVDQHGQFRRGGAMAGDVDADRRAPNELGGGGCC